MDHSETASVDTSITATGPHSRRGKRVRDLLRNFYGLQTEGAAQASPTDLDSPNFDVQKYMEKLLAKDRLSNLKKTDETMKGDIKELDGKMKNLVYENYNKFISATDTIRTMKSKEDDMEEELKKLRETIAAISDGSANVNTSLVAKRDRINQLSHTSSMLRSIESIFELPSTLRRNIEKGKYLQAYEKYAKVKKFLKNYTNIPSFMKIQKESDEIMKNLVGTLQRKLRDENTKSGQLAECVRVLINLGEPGSTLWKEFKEIQKKDLMRTLKEMENKLHNDIQVPVPEALVMKEVEEAEEEEEDESETEHDSEPAVVATPSPAVIPPDPFRNIEEECSNYIKTLEGVVQLFTRLFLFPHDEKPIPTENLREAEKDLTDLVKSVTIALYETMERIFNALFNLPYWYSRSSKLLSVLSMTDENMHALATLLPRAGLETDTQKWTRRVLESYTTRIFEIMFTNLNTRLEKLHVEVKEKPEHLAELLLSLSSDVLNNFTTHLTYMEIFMDTKAESVRIEAPHLASRIKSQAIATWKQTIQTIRTLGEQKSRASNAPEPILALLLSKLCLQFASSTTREFFNTVGEIFSADGKRNQLSYEIGDNEVVFKELGQDLANRFVELTGQKIGAMIKNNVENKNWMNLKEPRRVSPLCQHILQELTEVNKSVVQIYPDDSRSATGSDSSRRTGGRVPPTQIKQFSSGKYNSQLMNNIDKLFSEKIEIFGPVEYTKNSIVSSVVKIVIKTFIECIRLKTFSRGGFQQIEVDAEFLRVYFYDYAPENILNNLLQELVSSAYHRCVDPVSIEPAIIRLLVNETEKNNTEGDE